jgi:putative transposase
MSTTMDEQIKRWTALRKSALVMEILQGKTPVAEASRQFDLTPSDDLCRVWCGRDRCLTMALVMDCHSREILGWQLSRSGKATTATAALEPSTH